jgi:hypothetical protein
MDWLSLAALGIIWAVLLVPNPIKRSPPSPLRRYAPIEQEDFRQPGRWIISPRRGSRFVGPKERARLRARERRRQVLVFLVEAIGLTGLIGMFPPLRGMLLVTGALASLLLAYLVMIVMMVRLGVGVPAPQPDEVVAIPEVMLPIQEAVEAQDRRLVRVAAR